MWDDALSSYYSIGQAQHWHWQLFYSSESDPPLFFWMLALFYRLFPPSLFSLWFFPGLLSILVLLAGYWACRRYFSKSLSFFCALILAFSFWPLFLGTFCQIMVLFTAWECLCLGLFALFLQSRPGKNRIFTALGLGLGLGSGLYVWILSIPVIFVLSVGALRKTLREKPGRWGPVLAFALPVLLLALPISLGIFRNVLAGHVQHYLIFSQPLSLHQLSVSFSYVTALLWGTVDKSYFNFGPLWGGFFNPILGAAFLLGIVEIFGNRRKFFFFGTVGLLALGLLPGVLSANVEVMRILPLLPLAVVVAAVGWRRWLLAFPKRRRIMALVLSASFSAGLDLCHLGFPYHQWAVPGAHSNDSKSPERYRAFQILDLVQAREGPGLILTEFVPNIFDQSLLISTYPFNAARNPALDPQKAHWAAVLADDSFRSYFARRFPRSQNYPLFDGLPALEGNLVLFLLPLDSQAAPVLQKWLEAHRQIQGLFGLMPYHIANPDYGPAVESLKSCRGSFQGDTFLESCYWEKLADLMDKIPQEEAMQCLREEIRVCGLDPALRWRKGYFLERLGEDERDLKHDERQALLLFHSALQTGYESPKFYRYLAQLEMDQKNYRQALWDFQQCRRLEPQNPPPAALLQWLQGHLSPSGKVLNGSGTP